MATDQELLVVRIEARLRQFERAMAQATGGADRAARRIETRFKRMESTLGGIGSRLGGLLGLTIGAVGFRQLASAIDETVSKAAGLVDLADKIGITTDALQELRFQADQQGSSAEALDAALEQFSRRVGLAAAGSGKLVKILEANNVALRDSEGNLRPLTALLADYADLIKNAANEQDQAVLATEAFGKAGDEMAIALRGGSAEIELFKQRAHELGLVVSEDGVRALESFEDELSRLRGRWNAAMTDMTVVVLRFLETVGRVEHQIIDPFLGIKSAAEQTLPRIKEIEAEIVKTQEASREGLIDPSAASSRIQELQAEFIELQRVAALAAKAGAAAIQLNPDRVKDDAVTPSTTPAAATVLPNLGGGGGNVEEIERTAEAYSEVADSIDDVAESYEGANAVAQAFGFQAIDAVEGLLDGTTTLNDSLADTLKMLRRMVLEALLLGQGPLGQLLGGGGGGLLGSLFGGARAAPAALPLTIPAPSFQANRAAQAGSHVVVQVQSSEFFDARVARVSGAVTAQAITQNNRTMPQRIRDASRDGLIR